MEKVIMTTSTKMKMCITGDVLCTNVPTLIENRIKEDLTFENQQFLDAVKYGDYSSPNIDQYHYFFEKSDDGKGIWVPRGYIFFLRRILKQNRVPFEIVDNTTKLPEIDIQFHGELRGYQHVSVNHIVSRYPVGVVEAATGSGKTVIANGVIAHRKQPTIVIVHTKELMYQWQGAIKKFLDYDCGLLGDGKNNIKPITVGIINTIRNRVKELHDRFGQVVIDECHRTPSSTWTNTIQYFCGKYFLGLTATAFRRDGLGQAIFYHIGPRVHSVNKEMLQQTKAVLKPQIFLVKSNFGVGRHFVDDMMPYSTVLKSLTENHTRNTLITDTICEDLTNFNESMIVVSDRVNHIKELSYILKKRRIDSRIISGSVSGKPTDSMSIDRMKREDIVEEVKAGQCKVLFSTISLIGEGFDLPDLHALFLTTPIKFAGRLIQVCGRVLRPKKGKVPRIYDFRDDNIRVLQNSGAERNRIYQREGW